MFFEIGVDCGFGFGEVFGYCDVFVGCEFVCYF
jgi:hypothetical protein